MTDDYFFSSSLPFQILDASWYMPDDQRNPFQEFQVQNYQTFFFNNSFAQGNCDYKSTFFFNVKPVLILFRVSYRWLTYLVPFSLILMEYQTGLAM